MHLPQDMEVLKEGLLWVLKYWWNFARESPGTRDTRGRGTVGTTAW